MADDDDNGGFLSRWARRKAQVKQGVPPVVPAAAAVVEVPAPAVSPHPDPLPEGAKEEAALTLDDVKALTPESDFSRFVAPAVDPSVKNAALKKLFADPHYNVMDGLDTYIDDYNKFEPIPKAMLRQLVSARVLGLIDDELEEQPRPDNPPPHEDAAVQLQPDDAARSASAERGIEPAAGDADPPDAVPPRSA